MPTPVRPVSYTRYDEIDPQQTGPDGTRTWIARGANFVVTVSRVRAGSVLSRENHPDEYMVLLPDTAATLDAADAHVEAAAQTLAIMPPGASAVTARDDGLIVRIFSNEAADLLALASNGELYADGAPDVAALVPWPSPPDGFRIRVYPLAEHVRPDVNARVFRSSNLMLNILNVRETPRDTSRLSPHAHGDFEQGSLALSGAYVHHCRYPWGPDLRTWRDDEHTQIGSPSLMVVPPGVVHTSMNVGSEPGWLIDIFAPPRADFSARPDFVRNAAEYPMPPVNP
ncbi:hypothetical protein [Paraburkholderia caballeronis]|uniref:Mannose-6-phosphate isomerase, cupin superfamily n=1 Tax=Paraburkholderia caballeronis TaxID=416943 RepID=A0A1H7JC30_9BURK|nr:hypothetical protein [Paraburkholderia caballeronis]PXW27507.1 mannose-6-phosphate isomerase-like protein (cupin superfamily) [Paraburkholderia caballeronis]PXX02981.1 mannose-6-phosphate isomerase-like protein (cupin superfamily) [Paraburkholderia caballeronis]RAK03706.1 mannose-6-phosphate isomerase-like protein (cupin superfamily) [Paraburkholderia caballeronis]TDV06135.1 mannose-6-phosphate isomerase-like protein (cupin superfamily) [Paraburkholderia caballeronis]TDV09675.1 mannose-6-ph